MKTGFQDFFPELSTFEYGCLVDLHIKEGKKQRLGGEGTDEQPLSDKPPLIRCR